MPYTNVPQVDDDDPPIGRVLSRREALTIIGAGGGALIVAACAPSAIGSLNPSVAPASATPGATAASSLPACVVKPELTEGPFFVDEKIERSDVRTDSNSGTAQEGIPLALAFAVSKVSGNGCTAFEGAVVDVWHCNAAGEYSDIAQNGTVGQNFLRGYQVTDANGSATFTTIYPGWYQGRTVHIHFKIRTEPAASSGLEFTSQLFFDESVTAEVFAQAPYAGRGTQDTTNANDGIYRDGGSQLLLTPMRSGSGYAATFEIGVAA
jgi:protocatechuate 3,4-dioxygenase beta subunit